MAAKPINGLAAVLLGFATGIHPGWGQAALSQNQASCVQMACCKWSAPRAEEYDDEQQEGMMFCVTRGADRSACQKR